MLGKMGVVFNLEEVSKVLVGHLCWTHSSCKASHTQGDATREAHGKLYVRDKGHVRRMRCFRNPLERLARDKACQGHAHPYAQACVKMWFWAVLVFLEILCEVMIFL